MKTKKRKIPAMRVVTPRPKKALVMSSLMEVMQEVSGLPALIGLVQ